MSKKNTKFDLQRTLKEDYGYVNSQEMIQAIRLGNHSTAASAMVEKRLSDFINKTKEQFNLFVETHQVQANESEKEDFNTELTLDLKLGTMKFSPDAAFAYFFDRKNLLELSEIIGDLYEKINNVELVKRQIQKSLKLLFGEYIDINQVFQQEKKKNEERDDCVCDSFIIDDTLCTAVEELRSRKNPLWKLLGAGDSIELLVSLKDLFEKHSLDQLIAWKEKGMAVLWGDKNKFKSNSCFYFFSLEDLIAIGQMSQKLQARIVEMEKKENLKNLKWERFVQCEDFAHQTLDFYFSLSKVVLEKELNAIINNIQLNDLRRLNKLLKEGATVQYILNWYDLRYKFNVDPEDENNLKKVGLLRFLKSFQSGVGRDNSYEELKIKTILASPKSFLQDEEWQNDVLQKALAAETAEDFRDQIEVYNFSEHGALGGGAVGQAYVQKKLVQFNKDLKRGRLKCSDLICRKRYNEEFFDEKSFFEFFLRNFCQRDFSGLENETWAELIEIMLSLLRNNLGYSEWCVCLKKYFILIDKLGKDVGELRSLLFQKYVESIKYNEIKIVYADLCDPEFGKIFASNKADLQILEQALWERLHNRISLEDDFFSHFLFLQNDQVGISSEFKEKLSDNVRKTLSGLKSNDGKILFFLLKLSPRVFDLKTIFSSEEWINILKNAQKY